MKRILKFGVLVGAVATSVGVLSILVNHHRMKEYFGLDKKSNTLDTDDFDSFSPEGHTSGNYTDKYF